MLSSIVHCFMWVASSPFLGVPPPNPLAGCVAPPDPLILKGVCISMTTHGVSSFQLITADDRQRVI